MTTHSAENIIDRVWSEALDKIMKGGGAPLSRSNLGGEIDLAVAQAASSALLSRIPAFTKLLYNGGYEAASRNTYLVLRRLGMPSDFFWKFDYWDEKRAFETLNKVITRVFTALMSKQKMGELHLTAVDPERGTFEITFDGCAECAGLHTQGAMCFFHAGSFAGMLAAMFDRDLDAHEVECIATGGALCRFEIASRDERGTGIKLGRWCEEFACDYEPVERFDASLGDRSVRATGNMVDIGYYQMLLASAFLPNIEVIERACFESGQEIGRALAKVVRDRFGDDPVQALPAFYKTLRYANLGVELEATGEYRVTVGEAPEHLGSLEGSKLVPFLTGELESLVSDLGGKPVTSSGRVDLEGTNLVFRFVPQL